jgi:cell division protein FtsB
MNDFLEDVFDIAKNIGKIEANLEAKNAEIKKLRADNERLKAFIADKIHDATRERMLMELEAGNG